MVANQRKKRLIVWSSIGAAIAFSIFAVFAQTQALYVPILTPTTMAFEGLQAKYRINDTLSYAIDVKGYGSNCHQLEVITTYNGAKTNRVDYYSKADDCRFMTITHGPYNFTRSFSYGGKSIFGKEGNYTVDATFTDLIDHQITTSKRSFIVQRRI